MFNILLQINNSEPEKLDKDLSTIATVSGILKNETSLIDPVIIIECDLSNYVTCNYMSIPAFGRNYFITNIRSISAGLVEFSGHVDVLTTYKAQIRQNTAIVRRQENEWNLYLNDGSFKVYQNPLVLTKEFPYGFSSQEYVLALAGKGGNN